MTQFAMQQRMDEYTIKHIRHALFDSGEYEISASLDYNEIGIDWSDPSLLNTRREYEKNTGWAWDQGRSGEGLLWGGCLESIDEMLRNNIQIPRLEDFEGIVLFLETSEEIPSHAYVRRVLRALGQRGILGRIQGVLMGRPKAWEFDKRFNKEERDVYVREQQQCVIDTVRVYNNGVSIVQNLNFGHTDPQIPMPYGGKVRIDSNNQKIFVSF